MINLNSIYIHKDGGEYRTLATTEVISSNGNIMTLVEYEDIETKEIFYRTIKHFEKSFKIKG